MWPHTSVSDVTPIVTNANFIPNIKICKHHSCKNYCIELIQSCAIIIRSNIVRYWTHQYSDNRKTRIRLWTNKRHSIPRTQRWAIGCLLRVFWSTLVEWHWWCCVQYMISHLNKYNSPYRWHITEPQSATKRPWLQSSGINFSKVYKEMILRKHTLCRVIHIWYTMLAVNKPYKIVDYRVRVDIQMKIEIIVSSLDSICSMEFIQQFCLFKVISTLHISIHTQRVT